MKRLVFMAALLCVALAPPASAATTTFEAESFTKTAGKRVENVTDATASGGAYTDFFTTGTINSTVTVPASTEIEVMVRTPQSCGSETARVSLRLDGALVLDRVTVPTTWTRIVRTRSISAGNHTVEVSFTNDYFEPSNAFSVTPRLPLTCDRNLRVDTISFTGTPTQPPTQPPSNPPGTATVLHRADAERAWDQDWAAYSCQNATRFTQVTDPRNQGARAYAISVQDGDNSYGERCELSLGNTSSSNIQRVGGAAALFHRNQEVWIAGSWLLPTNYSFAASGAPVGITGDGGLVEQLKQLGSCGTPALGIVATRTIFAVRNSAGNNCENASMRSLFKWPMVLGRWVKVLQHVKFSTDRSVGFFELEVDADGDANWNPVPIAPATGISGTTISGNRIYTHTMKSPTDHPAACPASDICSHGRVGIYRDPDVTGPSTVYVDGWNFATDRASAVAVAFP